MRKWEQSAGDDGSTLASKLMGRVSLKQGALVAPQNGDIVTAKNYKKNPQYSTGNLCTSCDTTPVKLNGYSWNNAHSKFE